MNYKYILMAPPAEGENGFISLLPYVLIIFVFYFFMIRPQLKKQKEQKKFRESLNKGDKVVTIGGVHGKIVEVKENVVVIEIAKDMNIRIEKSAISSDFANSSSLQSGSK